MEKAPCHNNGEPTMITSPRKLQEMSLPVSDGHDITAASGTSMKQYEDQLSGLRKENFHLKLRIYFLEEKLGTGAPPAVQGLLEHNVRLQVEVEELRRQLSDKQELLAAAAEAIDVLEHQGSISADSIDGSVDQPAVPIKVHNENESEAVPTCNETCLETESVGENLGIAVDADGQNELMRVRREYRKALQMIKGCVKKIQQQDRDIKKLKLNKESASGHVSDSQLEKYEEIVKCKDEHIKDLENKVMELQKNIDIAQTDNVGNLQELLTRRLQGLAYFLDKLLSHKCVLGEDKKKMAESILQQSLALPVGLQLDESLAPEDFTMDESNVDMSQSLRIEDLTLMFGHHVGCGEGEVGGGAGGRGRRGRPRRDLLSESECWSEPDRNVSMARIGLDAAAAPAAAAAAAARPRRARLSRSDDNEPALRDDIAYLSAQLDQAHSRNEQLTDQLRLLETERNELTRALADERANLLEQSKATAKNEQAILVLEMRVKDLEQACSASAVAAERARAERGEAEAAATERERALRHACEEAALQASQAALERACAQRDKLRLERELDAARDELCAARDRAAAAAAAEARAALAPPPPASDDERPTSPDQGIDSDRLSSLEQNDALTLSPRSLYEENLSLKQKLSRTKATLADTLAQLNAANMRKRSVQRAICREIHKTQGVLRKARDQLDTHN